MEEVIWIGVVILWMIGAAQRGAKRKAERETGMEAAASSPTKQKPDWRDRILEAAKEWEAEQQRQAGELPGLPEGTRLEPEEPRRGEQSRSRQGAGAERLEAQRASAARSGTVVVRDVTPDRTAVAGDLGSGRMMSRPLSREVDAPRSRDQLPDRTERRAVTRRPTTAAMSSVSARRPGSSEPRGKPIVVSRQKTMRVESAGEHFLSRLEHYTPLQRAILLTQILGPPKGLEEEPAGPPA